MRNTFSYRALPCGSPVVKNQLERGSYKLERATVSTASTNCISTQKFNNLIKQSPMKNKINEFAKSKLNSASVTLIKKDNIKFTKTQSMHQQKTASKAMVNIPSVPALGPKNNSAFSSLQGTLQHGRRPGLSKPESNILIKLKMRESLVSPQMRITTQKRLKENADLFSPGILESNKRRAEHKTCEATTEASTRKYGTIEVPSAGSRWNNKAATRDDFSSCLKDFRS